MSEQKKKVMGRGRGKLVPKAEGPWLRSKKVEEAINTNKNQEDALSSIGLPKRNEFELSPSNFPPLPGSSGTERDFKATTDVNRHSKEETRISNNDSNTSKDESSNLKVNEKNESAGYEDFTDKIKATQIDKKEPLPTTPTFIDKECSPKASSLNPGAKEFVPKTLAISSLDPCPQGYVNDTTHSKLYSQGGLSENYDNDGGSFHNLLSEVEESVNFCYTKICESPASYDEVMDVLKPYFERFLRHREITTKIVETIYNYATTDTSFTYHAVRTLTYLDTISYQINQQPYLRDDTLKLAERKNSELHIILRTDGVTYNDVFPFLLFLSELYIHLEVGSIRLSFLGSAIVGTLRKLLPAHTLPIKDRLSITVTIVKLTGTFLDEEPQGVLNSLMEDLGNKLIEEKPNLDENTITMVEILIKLRRDNWGEGRNENLNNSGTNQLTNGDLETVIPMENGQELKTSDGSQFYRMSDNTVFYGPDGNVMPYEEQMFLELSSNYMYDEDGPSRTNNTQKNTLQQPQPYNGYMIESAQYHSLLNSGLGLITLMQSADVHNQTNTALATKVNQTTSVESADVQYQINPVFATGVNQTSVVQCADAHYQMNPRFGAGVNPTPIVQSADAHYQMNPTFATIINPTTLVQNTDAHYQMNRVSATGVNQTTLVQSTDAYYQMNPVSTRGVNPTTVVQSADAHYQMNPTFATIINPTTLVQNTDAHYQMNRVSATGVNQTTLVQSTDAYYQMNPVSTRGVNPTTVVQCADAHYQMNPVSATGVHPTTVVQCADAYYQMNPVSNRGVNPTTVVQCADAHYQMNPVSATAAHPTTVVQCADAYYQMNPVSNRGVNPTTVVQCADAYYQMNPVSNRGVNPTTVVQCAGAHYQMNPVSATAVHPTTVVQCADAYYQMNPVSTACVNPTTVVQSADVHYQINPVFATGVINQTALVESPVAYYQMNPEFAAGVIPTALVESPDAHHPTYPEFVAAVNLTTLVQRAGVHRP